MNLTKIARLYLLLFKENFRRRITILLMLLIPAVFYFFAINTTTTIPMLIRVATGPGEPVIMIKPRELSLIYIGLAATGFIASFMALNLMQSNRLANKRLVLCGYTAMELSMAKFMFILSIVFIVGIYVALPAILVMSPKNITGVVTGYLLCGFVYASFGLIIGTTVKKELEGILFIVLLANLDIGWLQNPIFYAAAPDKQLIRFLPGFNPSQVAIVSAFTNFQAGTQIIYSLIYGTIFLMLSVFIFRITIKTR